MSYIIHIVLLSFHIFGNYHVLSVLLAVIHALVGLLDQHLRRFEEERIIFGETYRGRCEDLLADELGRIGFDRLP